MEFNKKSKLILGFSMAIIGAIATGYYAQNFKQIIFPIIWVFGVYLINTKKSW